LLGFATMICSRSSLGRAKSDWHMKTIFFLDYPFNHSA
jgi:hypothetical protein